MEAPHLALRAARLVDERLDDLPEPQPPARLREPPTDDIPRRRVQRDEHGDGDELPEGEEYDELERGELEERLEGLEVLLRGERGVLDHVASQIDGQFRGTKPNSSPSVLWRARARTSRHQSSLTPSSRVPWILLPRWLPWPSCGSR